MNGDSRRSDASKTATSVVSAALVPATDSSSRSLVGKGSSLAGPKFRRSLTISRYQSQRSPQKNW